MIMMVLAALYYVFFFFLILALLGFGLWFTADMVFGFEVKKSTHCNRYRAWVICCFRRHCYLDKGMYQIHYFWSPRFG